MCNSKTKEDIVVNPPQNPVISNSLSCGDRGVFSINEVARSAIIKQPAILEKNVPQGNV